MSRFSLPTTGEVQGRVASNSGKAAGSDLMSGASPFLGWAGIVLQALGANSQQKEQNNALAEQKKQLEMNRVLGERTRRDSLQQQSVNNFNTERATNMQGIGMLANMRMNQSGNKQYSSFRRDLMGAAQAIGGGK